MRLVNFVIAFFAVLALFAGSTALHGLPYWVFSGAIIAGAIAVTFALYVRRSRAWVTEAYRLLGEGRLSELKPRVEAELAQRQSSIARPVLELLEGEVLFWSGDFEGALAKAKAIELQRMPELWRSALLGLRVAALAFTGRAAEARAGLSEHREALAERPGFHYLEAVVALRGGDAAKARERLESVKEEPAPRMPMVRAARALLRAELALGRGEEAGAFVAEAIAEGGESFVPARARSLTENRS